MTSVNVTQSYKTIVVTEETGKTATVTAPSQAVTIQTVGVGPQGPPGPPGENGLIVNDTNRVNKSLVYFDAASTTYKADATITDLTLTDGGNF